MSPEENNEKYKSRIRKLESKFSELKFELEEVKNIAGRGAKPAAVLPIDC